MNKTALRKILSRIAINIISLLLIIFLVIATINISPDLGFEITDNRGNIISNINYEAYKSTVVESVKGLFSGQYFETVIFRKGIVVTEAMKIALGRSMRVLFISFILAMTLGIPKGIFDSRRKKKQSTFKLLQTLIPLSVPDVLIISLVQLLGLYLYKNKISIFGIGPVMYIGYEHWTHYIYPIIALSLIPVAYIARVTSTSIETVYDRDYILAARGKGCSETRIILNHSMRNVLTDLIASFPAIVSIMFSSLFIVERLFYFPGVTFEMMEYYTRPATDGSTTVALLCFAVALAIIFFLLYTALDILRQVIVPRRN